MRAVLLGLHLLTGCSEAALTGGGTAAGSSPAETPEEANGSDKDTTIEDSDSATTTTSKKGPVLPPVEEEASEFAAAEEGCMPEAGGAAARGVVIKGENWPGNSLDAGGADYDDYGVTISGSFFVDGFRVYSLVDQEIDVRYSLGTPGTTTQTVRMQVVDCRGSTLGLHDVASGAGTLKLHASAGDMFTLETTATTAGVSRRFSMPTDGATAFKMEVQP